MVKCFLRIDEVNVVVNFRIIYVNIMEFEIFVWIVIIIVFECWGCDKFCFFYYILSLEKYNINVFLFLVNFKWIGEVVV